MNKLKMSNKLKTILIITIIICCTYYFFPRELGNYMDKSRLISNVKRIEITQDDTLQSKEVIITDSDTIELLISNFSKQKIRKIVPSLDGGYWSEKEDYTIVFFGNDQDYYGTIDTLGEKYLDYRMYTIKDNNLKRIWSKHPRKIVGKENLEFLRMFF